ncbi:MAG: hypothetical protein WA890_31265, partial [Micromonospora sp.]
MSPDTADPDRPAEPGQPAADRPSGGTSGSPRPAPDAERPVGFAPLDPNREVPGWPAGVPVPAGTPVTAPGADPLVW